MSNKVEISTGDCQEYKMLASIPLLANNSILILNKNGTIQWVNQAFENLYGFGLKDVNKHKIFDNSEFVKILHDTDRNFFKNSASFSFSRTILAKNGEIKWIQSTLTPVINNSDLIEKFIVVETDITQQKEVEEELVQRWENTQTLTEHLESVKDYIEEQIKELNTQKHALEIAKEKSEEVLNKVLPYEVAIQLKKKGYASPRHYKKVTILNMNIRNFIKLTDDMDVEDLVQQLHEVLVGFDSILEQHYVEKIKTVGGNYLGAGGVPLRNRSNPIDVVLVALSVMASISEINTVRTSKNMPIFELGLGIHTGKVIAGVVGKNKLTYDIWGDTVNIASTIEHNVKSSGIYISEITYLEIDRFFDVKPCENLILGSAEEIKIFEVLKIKDKFAMDALGVKPNQEFLQILSKL